MRLPALLFLAVALPAAASADLIVSLSSLPVGIVPIEFDGGSSVNCSSGPKSVIDAGFGISSDGPACMPYSGNVYLEDNGLWENKPSIGDVSGATTITIDLGGNFGYVGGFMSYGFIFDYDTFSVFPAGNDPTITALDSNHNVLQSYDIFALTGLGQFSDVNDGAYYGISSGTYGISYLQISGSGIVMSDIGLGTPEPSTWTLLVIAFLALLPFIVFPRTFRGLPRG
jgi:hypothetical protein